MWTEDKAKRGSSEVASVILKFFRKNPPKAKQLLVYTDNCAGQNKNWLKMSLWLQMIREGLFEKIEHRFLVSGHTFLPSDRDFALIEKYKKKKLIKFLVRMIGMKQFRNQIKKIRLRLP